MGSFTIERFFSFLSPLVRKRLKTSSKAGIRWTLPTFVQTVGY